MKTDDYIATLSPEDRPVFMQHLSGFSIPSRPDLGSYPDSFTHAVHALANDRGIELEDVPDDESPRRYGAPPFHWPSGSHADGTCPFCGHVDSHQISIIRDMGLNARDGSCSACFGDYLIEANNGVVSTKKLPRDLNTYLVQHHYDIGDQGVTITAPEGFDARRAAVYMQFCAEEWFGVEKMVTNLGIASALVTYYGCKHAARSSRSETIDMYGDREAACAQATSLKADDSLRREGLRGFLEAHLDG